MLAASKEGEHFSQLKYKRFLHKVEQQRYTPKEPKDSRKLHFDTRQCIGHIGITPEASWKACIENFNPQVINRNIIVIKKMEKWSHWCVSCSVGAQYEDHPLIWSTVPSSLIADSTVHPVSSIYSTYYRALHSV